MWHFNPTETKIVPPPTLCIQLSQQLFMHNAPCNLPAENGRTPRKVKLLPHDVLVTFRDRYPAMTCRHVKPSVSVSDAELSDGRSGALRLYNHTHPVTLASSLTFLHDAATKWIPDRAPETFQEMYLWIYTNSDAREAASLFKTKTELLKKSSGDYMIIIIF